MFIGSGPGSGGAGESRNRKFEPAAVRWLARLALEAREIRLDGVQLVAAALGCLRGRRHETAERTLFTG
jgi:hypothetical protein